MNKNRSCCIVWGKNEPKNKSRENIVQEKINKRSCFLCNCSVYKKEDKLEEENRLDLENYFKKIHTENNFKKYTIPPGGPSFI